MGRKTFLINQNLIVSKVKNIVSKLDDRQIISNIEEDESGINVYIGKESKIDDDVTIVKTKYIVDGAGTIAILVQRGWNMIVLASLITSKNIESDDYGKETEKTVNIERKYREKTQKV